MSSASSVVILSDEDDSNSSSAQKPQRNIAVKRTTAQPAQPTPETQQALSRGCPKGTKTKRDMEFIRADNSTFLSDFNPLNSRREKNKQYRNFYGLQKARAPAKKQTGALYDEQGRLRSTGEDICDCFDKNCEGCHFPCEWCQSEKCGLRCRNNRRFMYEVIEYDGKDKVTHNPYLPKQ